MEKEKIILILGPTSSGKSDLAVKLAKKFNGEVISADSRQVYKGLNIGTGKITKKEMLGIPHHLLDVEDPKKTFSVAQYKILAEKAIEDILSRGKLTIICGGTGFYIQAIVDNVILPDVKADKKLRKELSGKTSKELFEILNKLDPNRAKNIDPQNLQRLIRAIEIAKKLGKVPAIKTDPKYETLQIGIDIDDINLREKINNRVLVRIKKGMIKEAEKLHKEGLSWKRMNELGLEYKYLAQFLQKKINKNELVEKIKIANWHYARRQKTWFKKDKRIKWFNLDSIKKIESEVKNFI
jgi:tRNA dimethylallyltransferase